jgi:hypothetical protein
MIDPNNPPKLMQQPATGRIYIYNPKTAENHPDMVPYEEPGIQESELEEPTMPVTITDDEKAKIEVGEKQQAENAALVSQEEAEKAKLQEENAALQAQLAAIQAEKANETPDAPADMTAEDRIAKIKAAVESIPVENYGSPYAGKPAMPKVKDVSEAAGFKVYADEVGLVMGLNMLA